MVAVDKAAMALETLRQVADGLDDRLLYTAQDLSIAAAVDGGRMWGRGYAAGWCGGWRGKWRGSGRR